MLTICHLISEGANIIDISTGGSHSIALEDTGSVWTWGLGNLGQLGIGQEEGLLDKHFLPQRFMSSPYSFTSIHSSCISTAHGSSAGLFLSPPLSSPRAHSHCGKGLFIVWLRRHTSSLYSLYRHTQPSLSALSMPSALFINS